MAGRDLFLLLALGLSFAAADTSKPNILFILADDLGYGDVGVYPNQHSKHGRIHTPRLDELARKSLYFSDAYAGAPVCAPSRCALMTGRHSGHCTVRENGQYLDANDTTVATVLKKAGYRTGLIGKWGLGHNGTVASPNNKGFHFFYGYISQENAHNYYPPFLWRNEEQDDIPANQKASSSYCGPEREKCVWAQDLFVNETLSFLEQSASDKESKPFYLFLSFTTPHAGGVGVDAETGVPLQGGDGMYFNESWPQVEKDFAAVITETDRQIGMILDRLGALGLDEDTIIFFASDNGAHNEGGHDYMFFESSGPLQGFKRSLHEGGHRSAYIIHWKNKTPVNVLTNQQTAFYDFLHTAADLASVPSSQLPPGLDGYSIKPTILGQHQDQPKFIYHEYCDPNEHHNGWGQAVRMQDWSALCIGDKPGSIPVCTTPQLFNLTADLHQDHDVSAQHPDVAAAFLQLMKAEHSPGHYCGDA